MKYECSSVSATKVSQSIILLGAAVAAFSLTASATAQVSVVQPTDPIVLVNGTNDSDTDSGPPPAGEIVSHAIDGVGQKYLNFLDLGSGFAVTPSAGPTILSGLRLYPANDEAPRDPASYLLEGSNGSFDGVFTTISSGDLALPATRNVGGDSPLSGLVFQELSFANTTAYTTYRLTFPTLKDAGAANSMQIAEVEFLGAAVPEPSSIALAGIAAGLGLLRRRFRWSS